MREKAYTFVNMNQAPRYFIKIRGANNRAPTY